MPRPSVLLFNTSFDPPGGGVVVAAWMIQALRDAYDVHVLSYWPVDLEALNRHCGTSLAAGDVTLVPAPRWLALLDRIEPGNWSFLVRVGMLRRVRRLRRSFDVVISPNDEMDLGPPGIQYVHEPWSHRHRTLSRRLRPWRIVSGYSFRRMRRNFTLANSEWTARRVGELLGVEARVLYPPVPIPIAGTPWEERVAGFVCVGRLVPDKRLDDALAIVRGLREAGHGVTLTIVGAPGTRPGEPEYCERLVRLAALESRWLAVRVDVGRDELARVLSRHRFGLHALPGEHFGIAVAELLRSGCIPFLAAGGGQQEIVGFDRRLVFSSVADAVERIGRVLADPGEQRALREALEPRRELYSEARFARELRAAVDDFRAGRPAVA